MLQQEQGSSRSTDRDMDLEPIALIIYIFVENIHYM